MALASAVSCLQSCRRSGVFTGSQPHGHVDGHAAWCTVMAVPHGCSNILRKTTWSVTHGRCFPRWPCMASSSRRLICCPGQSKAPPSPGAGPVLPLLLAWQGLILLGSASSRRGPWRICALHLSWPCETGQFMPGCLPPAQRHTVRAEPRPVPLTPLLPQTNVGRETLLSFAP